MTIIKKYQKKQLEIERVKNEKKNLAFNRIVKCIFSCKTIDQVNSCYKLINNFYELFKYDKYIHCSVEVLKEELEKIEKNL